MATRQGSVGYVLVRLEGCLLHRGRERHPETALQVADEALDLALGLGPIGPAQPRQEARVPCIVKEARMDAMHVPAVGIALLHHSLDVVVEHLARNPAKGGEGVLVAADQRPEPLIVAELDVGRPAPKVAISTDSCSEPRPIVAQSTCICTPGLVSNRATGSGFCAGRRPTPRARKSTHYSDSS